MLPILLIAFLSAVAQLFLPWWAFAPVAFVICYWQSSSAGKAFLQGAVGVAIVWVIYAGVLTFQNQGVLAARVGELLFRVPNQPELLLIISPIIGGLVGGLAGLAGFYIHQMRQPQSV